jgi:hypothetical protein
MKTLVALMMAFTAAATALAAERPLPFGAPGWELRGDRTAIVREDGREILQVETGFAYRRDVRIGDGSIDFDVQVTRRRSFVYCMFRMADDREYEEIYLRPHKSGLPDALQYAPVFQGRSGWQLYHGPGKTAAPEFEPGRWTHVRVLLKGPHAAVFIGDMNTPAMVMRLVRDARPGYLALRGFLPADVPGSGPIARFANVVVSDATPAFDVAASLPPAPVRDAGTVRAWAVSMPFTPNTEDGVPVMPTGGPVSVLTTIDATDDGLVELHRKLPIAADARSVAALARVHIQAARAGVRVFDLGFSDVATVFLNGRVIFRGDATYAFDRPRREGLIGFDQARLYLPLNAGDNELSVVVSDVFGGWAIMGRFASLEDLQVTAR